MKHRTILFKAAVVIFSTTGVVACSPAHSSAPFGIYAYDPASWNAEAAKQFPIVVVQYRGWKHNAKDIADIKSLAASGSRVIIDFELWQNARQRRGGDSPDPGDVMAQATTLLDGLDGVAIEAISLDEENLPTPQRLAMLDKVYHLIKAKYAKRRIVQWIAASVNLPTLDSLNLKAIGADGWIIDPYLMHAADYTAYVARMKAINPTIYSVVWAAPNWDVSGKYREAAPPSWWNGGMWRTFYSQIAINQSAGVPTIFYLFGLDAQKPKLLWSSGKCDRTFFEALTTKTLPYLQRHQLYPRAPAERPSWLPGYC